MKDYDVSLWVVRAWQGEVANGAGDEFDTLGWFASDELASVALAHSIYLGVLSSVLAGGRVRLTWSNDGATITKTLVRGVVVPQWASLLGTPRQAALNELRVNRLLVRVPPPVRAPRLITASRPGPSLTFEAVRGAPLGPKFPGPLSPADLGSLADLALALDSYRPRRRWFRRLYIDRRLAVHRRAGLLSQADADALAALAGRPGLKWGFGHGDITARNVLRETGGRLALIDWEWGGLYPRGYDLAFLWFSLVDVPDGRARVEAALPARQEAGFLLSAALVHLLHLQTVAAHPKSIQDQTRGGSEATDEICSIESRVMVGEVILGTCGCRDRPCSDLPWRYAGPNCVHSRPGGRN
jgi:Phosphotransferase enzyme family